MAKKTIEKYFSDLSGEELPKASSSLTFAFDGKSYEIDLTPGERSTFEQAVRPYIAVARPAYARVSGPKSKSTGPDPKVVRAWARDSGHDVPERGRIPAAIIEAYEDAH